MRCIAQRWFAKVDPQPSGYYGTGWWLAVESTGDVA